MRKILNFWELIFKCLWLIFCSKNFNTPCLGFERQWIWLQKRVDSFSIWFWFGFWLFLFVFSSLFYYNALARAVLSVCLFCEGRIMRYFIFCLLHGIFQRKKRSGWREERDWKTENQASELWTREKRYWQDRKDQDFQMNHFTKAALLLSL